MLNKWMDEWRREQASHLPLPSNLPLGLCVALPNPPPSALCPVALLAQYVLLM